MAETNEKLKVKRGKSNALPTEVESGSLVFETDTGIAYVDADNDRIQIKDPTKLSLTGGTMEGDIDMGENNITTSHVPEDDYDVVNKKYLQDNTGKTFYATCSTSSNTSAKTATCDGFTLEDGTVIYIKFENTNSAEEPTLNVNDTGSKSIIFQNEATRAQGLVSNTIYAFIYTDDSYEVVSGSFNRVDNVEDDNPTFRNIIIVDTDEDPNTLDIPVGSVILQRTLKYEEFNLGPEKGSTLDYGDTFIVPHIETDNSGNVIYGSDSEFVLPNVPESVSHAEVADEATHAISADSSTTSESATESEHANTSDSAKTADTAKEAEHASSADTATKADSATIADSATEATHATSADTATSAITADKATEANHASEADHATKADSSTTAESADEATKLSNTQTIDGVSFDGTKSIIHYGTCSTAAGTVAKTVSCTDFTLVTGSIINVTFSNTNTAASPTLNVNSTGAKNITFQGNNIDSDEIVGGTTYTFVYNGTSYEMLSGSTYRTDIVEDNNSSFRNIVIVDKSDNPNEADVPVGSIILQKSDTFSALSPIELSDDNVISHAKGTSINVGPNTSKALEFGESFTVPNVSSDSYGHVSGGSNITFTMPDKPEGAVYTGETPIEISSDNVIKHSTGTSISVGPTGNVALDHGSTFSVPSVSSDNYGHVIGGSDRTITSPPAYRTDNVDDKDNEFRNVTILESNEDQKTIEATTGSIILKKRPFGICKMYYGTCTTASGTANKVVACDGFELEDGSVVNVYFTNANTASTPRLNIDGTGALYIYCNGSQISSSSFTLYANTTYMFVYHDGYYEVLSGAGSYQLTSLSEQLDELNSMMKTMSYNMETISTEMETINTTVQSLQEEQMSQEEEIENLEDVVEGKPDDNEPKMDDEQLDDIIEQNDTESEDLNNESDNKDDE